MNGRNIFFVVHHTECRQVLRAASHARKKCPTWQRRSKHGTQVSPEEKENIAGHLRVCQCPPHSASRASCGQREFATCVPYVAVQSFQIILSLRMYSGGRTNTSSSFAAWKNTTDTSHCTRQRSLPRDVVLGRIRRMTTDGGVAAKTSSRLLVRN